MIISNDAQLSSTTTTRITRYFSVPSMLIFSTRPFFPPIFLISLLPHSVFLTFLTPSSSLRLPHSVFLTSSFLFRFPYISSSLLEYFQWPFIFSHFWPMMQNPSHCPRHFPAFDPFPPDWKKNSLWSHARAVIKNVRGCPGCIVQVSRSHFHRNVLTSLSLNHAAFSDLTSWAGH